MSDLNESGLINCYNMSVCFIDYLCVDNVRWYLKQEYNSVGDKSYMKVKYLHVNLEFIRLL